MPTGGFRYTKWIVAGLFAVAACYASAVATAVAYFRHDGLAVNWRDVGIPVRWQHVRIAQGDRQLLEAHARARDGQFGEALAYARSGLAKSPANRAGRVFYARLLAISAPSSAQEILLAGLSYHRSDPVYLAAVFDFLLRRQQDEQVIALARELIGTPSLPVAAARLAAHAAAHASFLRGNYDDAEDFLRKHSALPDSRDGRFLTARIDWERGFHDLALFELSSLASAHPADAEIYTEFVRCLRRVGRNDEARRVTLAFQIAHPKLAAPRFDSLRAYRDAGEHSRVAQEIDALLADSAHDPHLLATLAEFAADTGDVSLAHRIVELAQQRQLPPEPHAFLLIETLIVSRDYSSALAAIERTVAENPDWARQYRSLLDSLRAVAALGAGDVEASRLYLSNFLQQPRLRAENLLALADRFAALNASAQIRDVLARAVAADPLNQAALTRLIEIDLNLNRLDDLPAHLRRLVTMRRPSPDVLRVAQHKLGSDYFLFSAERGPALDAISAALDRDRAPLARLTAPSPSAP